MKNKVLIIAGLIAFNLSASAQKEYKISKSSGQLNLKISGAIIEGYDGKEIIITGKENEKEKVDERAKGLVAISGSGLFDNTGLGLNVTEKGDDLNVSMISNMGGDKQVLTIKVPKNIKINFSYNAVMNYGNVVFKNLTNEIEVSTTHNNIKLENNTGPMNVKTVYGAIDVIFNNSIKGPISLISVHDYVDVTLPISIKANVDLSTSYGKLYAAKELKIDLDNNEKTAVKNKNGSGTISTVTTTTTSGGKSTTLTSIVDDAIASVTGDATNFNFNNVYAPKIGDKIKGKINGGGVDIIIKSNYKNVYLRQK